MKLFDLILKHKRFTVSTFLIILILIGLVRIHNRLTELEVIRNEDKVEQLKDL